jgi:hypothetical protein
MFFYNIPDIQAKVVVATIQGELDTIEQCVASLPQLSQKEPNLI